MFDTMTLTKLGGGFCGALLIYLLGGWAAETIYHSGSGGHGYETKQAYSIPVDSGPAEDVVEVAFADVYATADAGAGERVFSKCRGCHKLADGENAAGPHLYALVDRAVSSVDGFTYSGSLVAVADVWSVEALNGFIESPRSYAPGTAMNFSGISDVEDRANLIAYLATIGG